MRNNMNNDKKLNIYTAFAMGKKIELRCILFLLITGQMVLHVTRVQL